MTKSIVITLTMICCCFYSFAQEVVSSSGESYSNASGSIDYTIGEVTIETVTDGTNTLTQGQHQPKLNINSVPSINNTFEVNLFPNPTAHHATLTVTRISKGLKYEVFDASGKIIQSANVNELTTTINLQSIASGQYFLKLTDDVSGQFNSFQLIKTN